MKSQVKLIIIIILLSIFSIFMTVFTVPKIIKLHESKDELYVENSELKTKYDSLFKAKKQVTIKYDTITDTLHFNHYLPILVEDTLIGEDTNQIRLYCDTIIDSTLTAIMTVRTLGFLLDADVKYTFKNKTVYIDNIVYVNKPVEVILYKEKTHLIGYGKIGYPFNYGFGVDLQRPKVIQYGIDYTNVNGKSYFAGKIGIKIF